METVFNTYLIPILIALVIGVIVCVWIFRGRSDDKTIGQTPSERVEAPAEPRPTRPIGEPLEMKPADPRLEGTEGDSVFDQGAAAATDVAGPVIGVEAHGELPGASGPPDNLQTLKGVGPKLVTKLNEHGITRFDQIAALSAADLERLDADMGAFRGRLARDRVVEQAGYLARGDRAGFEATFGKLGES